MFDELHDPDPPIAGMREYAAVAERAQAYRRRRATWAVRAVGVALVFAAGFAWYQLSNRSSNIAPAGPDSSVPSPTEQTAPPSIHMAVPVLDGIRTASLPPIDLGPGTLTVDADPVVELFENADGELCTQVDGAIDRDACAPAETGLYAFTWGPITAIAVDPTVLVELPTEGSCTQNFPDFGRVQVWICSDLNVESALVTVVGDRHVAIEPQD